MLAEKFIIYLEALRKSDQYQDGGPNIAAYSGNAVAAQEVKEKRPFLAKFIIACFSR